LQITPIIHAIRHSFRIPIAPGITFDRFVYSYVIYGDTIVLIDTGVAGSENQIFEDIRSTGRNPSEIALIILTHSHRTISERRGQFNRQPGAVWQRTRPKGHRLRISISRTMSARYPGS